MRGVRASRQSGVRFRHLPAIRATRDFEIDGCNQSYSARVPAKLTGDLTNDSDPAHYIRRKLQHGKFTPVGRQESHALFGLSQSNALLRVARGQALKADEIVDVHIWE